MGAWLQLLQYYGYETLLYYGTFVVTTVVFWTVSHYFNCPVITPNGLFILIQFDGFKRCKTSKHKHFLCY